MAIPLLPRLEIPIYKYSLVDGNPQQMLWWMLNSAMERTPMTGSLKQCSTGNWSTFNRHFKGIIKHLTSWNKAQRMVSIALCLQICNQHRIRIHQQIMVKQEVLHKNCILISFVTLDLDKSPTSHHSSTESHIYEAECTEILRFLFCIIVPFLMVQILPSINAWSAHTFAIQRLEAYDQ